MVATLGWVRDNYDLNKSRYIERDEAIQAVNDLTSGAPITREQRDAVLDAYYNNIILPEYGFHTLSTDVQSANVQSIDSVSTFNIPTGSVIEIDGVEVI